MTSSFIQEIFNYNKTIYFHFFIFKSSKKILVEITSCLIYKYLLISKTYFRIDILYLKKNYIDEANKEWINHVFLKKSKQDHLKQKNQG